MAPPGSVAGPWPRKMLRLVPWKALWPLTLLNVTEPSMVANGGLPRLMLPEPVIWNTSLPSGNTIDSVWPPTVIISLTGSLELFICRPMLALALTPPPLAEAVPDRKPARPPEPGTVGSGGSSTKAPWPLPRCWPLNVRLTLVAATRVTVRVTGLAVPAPETVSVCWSRKKLPVMATPAPPPEPSVNVAPSASTRTNGPAGMSTSIVWPGSVLAGMVAFTIDVLSAMSRVVAASVMAPGRLKVVPLSVSSPATPALVMTKKPLAPETLRIGLLGLPSDSDTPVNAAVMTWPTFGSVT